MFSPDGPMATWIGAPESSANPNGNHEVELSSPAIAAGAGLIVNVPKQPQKNKAWEEPANTCKLQSILTSLDCYWSDPTSSGPWKDWCLGGYHVVPSQKNKKKLYAPHSQSMLTCASFAINCTRKACHVFTICQEAQLQASQGKYLRTG